MVSEKKVAAFLKHEQLVLDIEDSTKLLEQFLPKELLISKYQPKKNILFSSFLNNG